MMMTTSEQCWDSLSRYTTRVTLRWMRNHSLCSPISKIFFCVTSLPLEVYTNTGASLYFFWLWYIQVQVLVARMQWESLHLSISQILRSGSSLDCSHLVLSASWEVKSKLGMMLINQCVSHYRVQAQTRKRAGVVSLQTIELLHSPPDFFLSSFDTRGHILPWLWRCI